MDAISRFWCEAVRRKSLMLEADEFDSAISYPLRADATEAERERHAWFDDKSRHDNPPPGGLLSDYLADEQFDGDRLPLLEEYARLANEERTDPDRLKAIKRVLSALVRLANHLADCDGKTMCDCPRCEAFNNRVEWWYIIERRLDRAFSALEFYVPADVKAARVELEETPAARKYTPPPCPTCGGQRIVTSTRQKLRHVKCEECDVTVKIAK
ncbi:MAG: hypothetical protein U0805_11450 [Pirellulales bacterium]